MKRLALLIATAGLGLAAIAQDNPQPADKPAAPPTPPAQPPPPPPAQPTPHPPPPTPPPPVSR